MTETELVVYCRELSWIAKGWQGASGVLFICCVWFACRYYFDVGLRIPRMRKTIRRVVSERDAAARGLATMRAKCEKIGLEAQAEIESSDARAKREREIRGRTEKVLIERNGQVDALTAELADERDVNRTLRQFLEAVQAESPTMPGRSESWISPEVVGLKSAT